MNRVNAIFHIVINTHNRQKTIRNDHREDLYRYIWKIIKNNDCVLYRINGLPNHLHILLDLKPTLALSDLVRQIKQSSSEFARTCGFFPDWNGWGKNMQLFRCRMKKDWLWWNTLKDNKNIMPGKLLRKSLNYWH